MSYGGTYTRTETFTDIPAEAGYRARTARYHDPYREPWARVVAWRLFEHSGGWPIVATQSGVQLLPRTQGNESLELLLPGDEEPA